MKTLRNIILLTAFVITIQTSYAQEGISFEKGTWSEVLTKAKSQDKLVFLDAYASWCGPCKWMAKNTFPDDEVASYYNAKFVNYKMDMEKGEGPAVAKTYNVDAYPSLLFVNSDGDLVSKNVGAMGPKDFMEMGASVADRKVKSLAEMAKHYESGAADRAFLHEYINRLADSRLNYKEPLEDWRKGMKVEDLMEEANWKMFMKVFRRTDTDEFKHVVANREKFEEKYGEDVVRKKLMQNYTFAMYMAQRQKDDAAYKAARKEFAKSGMPNVKTAVMMQDLSWYQSKKDWKKYMKTATKITKTDAVENSSFLNNISWTAYENVEKAKDLEKALGWAKKSVELDTKYYNLDTQAMLEYKLGKTDAAIATCKRAIEKAKEAGEDYSSTEKAMQEMMNK